VVISFPTNDGLTVTYLACPRDEFAAVRSDPERHLMDAVGLVAAFAEPFRGGTRVERIRGTGDLPNFFRQAFGDGCALVGDAAYHRIRSLRKASRMRSALRNGSPMRSMRGSRALAR
jgi:hypothetical protein